MSIGSLSLPVPLPTVAIYKALSKMQIQFFYKCTEPLVASAKLYALLTCDHDIHSAWPHNKNYTVQPDLLFKFHFIKFQSRVARPKVNLSKRDFSFTFIVLHINLLMVTISLTYW